MQTEINTWTPYNGDKELSYPGRNEGRRVLLLLDAPEVAIHDFVASAHQDGYGRFWLGIPGNWLGPELCLCGQKHGLIGQDWTVKAWMPAPLPGKFKHERSTN